jgi:integrase
VGWVVRRPGSGGRTRYTAVFRGLDGEARSAGTYGNRRDAARAWQRAEVDLAAGRVLDRRQGMQTLRQYALETWLPNHVVEASTRQGYRYLLNRYIVPELGDRRMAEIMPGHVREWVARLQEIHGARPPTVRRCKVVLDALFTTALNDQLTLLHPGKGVKTPHVATKPRTIITVEQFSRLLEAVDDDAMRLLLETDIETGLRWGELTELRPHDVDLDTRVVTVSRVVVRTDTAASATRARFAVKQYPKDEQWRRVSISAEFAERLRQHIERHGLGADDLMFTQPAPAGAACRRRPARLPDPEELGLTEPNHAGKQYRHGTTTAYNCGPCRCLHCRDALAAYRAERRAVGKDDPRPQRTITGDGHVDNSWFRREIWAKALARADLGIKITPHGLRHAHASWLLAGGADIQVVKERLGHGSIRTTEVYLRSLPGARDTALDALMSTWGARRRAGVERSEQKPAAVNTADLVSMLADIKQTLEAIQTNDRSATSE